MQFFSRYELISEVYVDSQYKYSLIQSPLSLSLCCCEERKPTCNAVPHANLGVTPVVKESGPTAVDSLH